MNDNEPQIEFNVDFAPTEAFESTFGKAESARQAARFDLPTWSTGVKPPTFSAGSAASDPPQQDDGRCEMCIFLAGGVIVFSLGVGYLVWRYLIPTTN